MCYPAVLSSGELQELRQLQFFSSRFPSRFQDGRFYVRVPTDQLISAQAGGVPPGGMGCSQQ